MFGWKRRQAVRDILQDRDIDVLIVTSYENRRYLTGFTGSAGWVVIGRSPSVIDDLLLTDFRYVEQAEVEADVNVQRCGRFPEQDVASLLDKQDLRVAFESEAVVYGLYDRLCKALTGQRLVPEKDVVERVRMVKDEEELVAITKAAAVADRAIGEVPRVARVGMKERELAAVLKRVLADAGSDGEAFPMIVASGPRSALAHGSPGDRVLGSGDLVVVDLGAVIDGYSSDITRAFVVGAADKRQKNVHYHVVRAMELAIEDMRPGRCGQEVDAVARDYLTEQGFGEYFGHSLGHGVGLSTHEGPRLASESDDILATDMVVTVEPGVYVQGWGGIRVEDLVHISDDRVQILTHSPRELIVVGE